MSEGSPPGPQWRKSSRSFSSGNCPEVAARNLIVGVRDSKHPGPVVTCTADGWVAFLGRVRAGASG